MPPEARVRARAPELKAPVLAAPHPQQRFSRRLDYLHQAVFRRLPIRNIDFSNPAEKSRHDQIVQFVEQMLALHQSLSAARTPQERTALERQITAADTQIDRLVYDLYGLTEEEIKLVEESSQ